jgi:hypothetical protein
MENAASLAFVVKLNQRFYTRRLDGYTLVDCFCGGDGEK